MKRYKPELLVVKGLFILALTLPLLDEIHQIPIAGRNFSWLDLIADISGFLVILLLIRTKVLKTGPGQDRNS